MRAHRHVHAAVDQQLDAQQVLGRGLEPLHQGKDRSRSGVRLLAGRGRREGGFPYGGLARHVELPRRVP